MTRVDSAGLMPHWIVIDNNSTDRTPEIASRYANVLPLQYLFEPEPGKNRALNRAIEDAELGEIVVFSDDDVTPEPAWLQSIAESAQTLIDVDVFGGRVEIRWPDVRVPGWAKSPSLSRWAFGEHHLNDEPCEYPALRYPCGPNFWIRRRVLEDGMRYDESVGPRPQNRIMGSETSFLMRLRREGYRVWYWPSARVEHRIQPGLITPSGIRLKAASNGRWMPRVQGPKPLAIYRCCRTVWYLYRATALGWSSARLAASYFFLSTDQRVLRMVDGTRRVHYNLECLRLAWSASPEWINEDSRAS